MNDMFKSIEWIISVCRMYGIYVPVSKFNKWFKLSTSIFCSSALCSTDYEINNLFLKIIFCNKCNKNLCTLSLSFESEWFCIEFTLKTSVLLLHVNNDSNFLGTCSVYFQYTLQT